MGVYNYIKYISIIEFLFVIILSIYTLQIKLNYVSKLDRIIFMIIPILSAFEIFVAYFGGEPKQIVSSPLTIIVILYWINITHNKYIIK